MSENQPIKDTKEVSKVPGTQTSGDKAAAAPKKVKKQWKNPALRAMGIPRFSFPSRNWMIFWSVLATVGGGIAYDKYEQKQIRNKWMQEVEKFSQEVYPNDRLPRKLTIFIAPPPNDFLDESLRYFKRYIKPVLNAAAVDYTVFTENRQGDIRHGVAEKIREMRKERLGVEKVSDDKKDDILSPMKGWFGQQKAQQELDDEPLVHRKDLYKPKDVLGLYKVFKPLEVQRDDEISPQEAGGVICIGRGAYKEYMTGVHEGLLGPLEKPPAPKKEPISPAASVDGELPADADKTEEKSDDSFEQRDEDEDDDRPPVPKPFISPSSYASAPLAPELNFDEIIRNDQNVPVIFEQPVYVYPVPNLLGFLNMPYKIYRFYTKRYVADDFGARTASIIDNVSRPYEWKDSLMAKEEELDWPKKWVARGKERGSEWVQELEVDERITSRMRVFEHSHDDDKK